MSKYKLFIITASSLMLAVIIFLILDLPLRCPFKLITGIPCPGCGGVRVAKLLMQGELLCAIETNPLSLLLIFTTPIALYVLYFDCKNGTSRLKNFFTTEYPVYIKIIIGVVIVANWVWNIYKGL